MKKAVVFLSALVVVMAMTLAVVSSCRRRGEMSGRDGIKPPRSQAVQAKHAGGKIATAANDQPKARPPKPVLSLPDVEEVDDDDPKFTAQEKDLARRIEKALDEESLKDALACASEALKCPQRDIREAMVDTLGWFGADALAEMTPFLADPDEDIRESAQCEWSMAISDIEEEDQKIALVEMAMNILNDEDYLDDISGEYIGVDEKLAVESLMRLIEANGSANGVAKAKETYEFVTGDEWQSQEEAARWLREEYEPADGTEGE